MLELTGSNWRERIQSLDTIERVRQLMNALVLGHFEQRVKPSINEEEFQCIVQIIGPLVKIDDRIFLLTWHSSRRKLELELVTYDCLVKWKVIPREERKSGDVCRVCKEAPNSIHYNGTRSCRNIHCRNTHSHEILLKRKGTAQCS